MILRGPGTISAVTWLIALATRTPYAVEVLGDNEAVYRDGGVGGRLRLLYALLFRTFQRKACRKAVAVSYVTSATLQSKYPNAAAEQFAVSDVSLPSSAIIEESRVYSDSGPLRIILVGSLDQPYKGVDIAIRALRAMTDSRRAHLTVLGDGRLRVSYEELAQKLGVNEYVHFAGYVTPGKAVIKYLDAADVFIMPSRTEGMPRALLEAMARGLPAFAARVGGIPELLDDSATFAPQDSFALARLLETVRPEDLSQMSAINLRRAQDFAHSRLKGRQATFLKRLSELSTLRSNESRLRARAQT